MKKLNLKLGDIKEMLTKEQMKKVVGAYGSYCRSGKCQLYISEKGIEVTGKCHQETIGGLIHCYCQNGTHTTDPAQWSVCNK